MGFAVYFITDEPHNEWLKVKNIDVKFLWL